MPIEESYIVQDKPKKTVREKIINVVTAPLLLPQWGISFLLSRVMTNIILSPSVASSQKTVQLIHFTDDPEEKGNVVINLLRRDPYKTLNDYLLKFSSIFHLSFLTKKRRSMTLNNLEDKAHIDNLISEIGLLLAGTSTAKKCKGKRFALDEIHLKGKEYLDEDLRYYLERQLQEKYGWQARQNNKTKLSFYSLETYDYAVLDSVALCSQSEESKPMSERKFVINCLANRQNYIRWMKDFSYSAKQIECTVISFNYRGIDFSQGLVWTENNMIDDVLAQVRMLLSLGAKPENIGLDGMCLGAAVATLAAAQLHDEDIKVKLYNERSFRSIGRTLVGFILPRIGSSLLNPLNGLRYLLALIIYVVFTPFIVIASWHMDVGRRWDSIPLAYKNYSIIRNFSDPDPNAPIEDGVIENSWASIASLIDGKRADTLKKKNQGSVLNTEEEQLLSEQQESHYFKVNPVFYSQGKFPHAIARRNLIQSAMDNKNPLTMHDHMIESFRSMFFQAAVPIELQQTYVPSQELIHHAVSI